MLLASSSFSINSITVEVFFFLSTVIFGLGNLVAVFTFEFTVVMVFTLLGLEDALSHRVDFLDVASDGFNVLVLDVDSGLDLFNEFVDLRKN